MKKQLFWPEANRKICLYDGVTILITDPDSIAYIKDNPEKFQLKGRYDLETGDVSDQIEGKFRNFDIWTGGNKRGKGIFIGGSLHKWKNRTHNFDTFYWHQLVKVCDEISEAFQFKPELAFICSLEAGLNIEFAKEWTYKAAQIPKNVVLLKNQPRKINKEFQRNKGFLLQSTKSEVATKMYDKGKQFYLTYELLRIENKFQKSRSANIKLFSELTDIRKHDELAQKLLKTFETLILFQPEIFLNKSLLEEDRQFLSIHQNENEWLRLRGNRKYKEFEKRVKHYNSLIDKYCPVNYKNSILQIMKNKINQ